MLSSLSCCCCTTIVSCWCCFVVVSSCCTISCCCCCTQVRPIQSRRRRRSLVVTIVEGTSIPILSLSFSCCYCCFYWSWGDPLVLLLNLDLLVLESLLFKVGNRAMKTGEKAVKGMFNTAATTRSQQTDDQNSHVTGPSRDLVSRHGCIRLHTDWDTLGPRNYWLCGVSWEDLPLVIVR